VTSTIGERLLARKLHLKQTEKTGYGLFASVYYKAGDPIMYLEAANTPTSKIVKWHDSFGVYFDRSYCITPDYSFCPTSDHPFWNMNHSCEPNAGFVNWGRIEGGVVMIAAYQDIVPGEQITADYSTFTTCYDGTPVGGAWHMKPCMCGKHSCRGTITGFEALPRSLQDRYLLADGATRGQVLAHVVHDQPYLVELLKKRSPTLFQDYQDALDSVYARNAEYQVTVGPSHAPTPRNKKT